MMADLLRSESFPVPFEVEPPPLVRLPVESLPPLKLRTRLKLWAMDRWWDARFWLGDMLNRAGDRVAGIRSSPVADCGLSFDLSPLALDPAPIAPAPDDMAGILTEWALGRAIAETYGLDHQSTWACLGRLPASHIHLIDSPQGWGMVAEWVAGELGATRDIYLMPSVH